MKFDVGVESHTFSIIGRCTRTGMLGIAITTSDLCVGSRCPYIRPLVGAVSTQAATDPRLGPFAIRLLSLGYSASRVIEEIETSDPHIERRQLGVVDQDGGSAARTGSLNAPWAGHVTGANYVAMGNALVGEQVVRSMALVFEDKGGEDLENRLLQAILAGSDAGGEAKDSTPYHSAALLVFAADSFARVDLRVDDHPAPLIELRRLLTVYKPRMRMFSLRARDPESAVPLTKNLEDIPD